MALDPAYQSLHNVAVSLQNQMRDALGGNNDPAAQNLRQQMQHLEDDVQSRKSPRDIEARIKQIQSAVQQASSSGTLINYSYADEFHDNLEDLRQQVRQMPDY
jgi:polyhydroxyalkanoate synthesis regulator phasin